VTTATGFDPIAARSYIEAGHTWVVDLHLAQFFDTVNHDHLMARMKQTVTDQQVLRLVNAHLKAGVMVDGVVGETHEGTPQGGPLSPLLSNIVLTELDRKLEERGHHFVRYADDCNIYVRSRSAAESDGQHTTVHRRSNAAEGQRGEKRSGLGDQTPVPGL
jgi:retron-type reverse transcriptase